MSRRLLPVLLVLGALIFDSGGSHGLALTFLLLAIPAAFVLALDCYADVLEARCTIIRPALAGLALFLLVLSAALRSPAVIGGVPKLAVSSLVMPTPGMYRSHPLDAINRSIALVGVVAPVASIVARAPSTVPVL